MKVIPKKKIMQYYKRFANGEQYIMLAPSGTVIAYEPIHLWAPRNVYNYIKPLIDLYCKDLSDEQLYGRNGLVSLLEPYQRDYNFIKNCEMIRIHQCTYGVLAVEDGSVDVDELCEEGMTPGKVLVYRQGSKPPELIKENINTTHYRESANNCLSKMQAITNMFVQSAKEKTK